MIGDKQLRGVKAVAFAGAALRVVSPEGEVIEQLDLTPGPIDLTPFHGMQRLGHIELDGVYPVNQRNGSQPPVIRSPRIHESAANPDFEPSSERRAQREMQSQINRIVNRSLQRADERRQRQAEERRQVEPDLVEDLDEQVQPEPAEADQVSTDES